MAHAAQAARPVTWDEFVALDDDDRRELIDGALLEIDVPNEPHERIVVELTGLLWQWAKTHGGRVYGSGYKVRISPRRGVMPDAQFVRAGHEGILRHEGIADGAPDLAVEVISPTSARYDRREKRDWYASIRVPEYWIVDPAARTLERFVLGADGRYVVAGTVGGDDVFRPDSFPGLEIPLADLWREPGA